MRPPRHTVTAVALLCLSALAVTGCSPKEDAQKTAAKLSPKLELRQASNALAKHPAVTTTLSLQGSAADVAALLNGAAEETQKVHKVFTRDEVTAGQAQVILDTAVSVTAPTAPQTGKDAKQAAASVAVRYAGGEVLEVRSVAGNAYLHVQTSAVTAKHPELADKLEVASALTDMLPGSKELLAGQWVVIPASDLAKLAKTSQPATGSVTEAKAAAEAVAAAKKSLSTLVEKSDVVRDTADPSHLVATVKGADVKTEALALVKAVVKDPAELKKAQDAINDVQVGTAAARVDFWVKAGALDAVEVDLSQFGGPAKNRVAVRAAFQAGVPVKAPQDPVQMSLAPLLDVAKGTTPAHS